MTRQQPLRIGAAVLLAIVLIAVIVWVRRGPRSGTSAADQAVPVIAATARQDSFVVYRSQPGTVKPASSVVVRSHVQGELTRVAFRGGQPVNRGDLLAEIDPRPFRAQLELAASDLARGQAQLANAEDTLKHYQALLAQDSISRQRVVDQQALVRQYAAAVTADQARVHTAELQLANTRIISPIAGTVGLRRVDPGNLVGPSDAGGIAVVTQSQPSKVVFALPVDVVAHVLERLQGGACIPVEAYGEGPGDVLGSGRLVAVNNQVDPSTGTVEFEASFANDRGTLLPNRFVTARLPIQVLPRTTLVPAAAIQQGAEGPFVYVVKPDRTAAVVPLKLGPGDETTTVVASGLAPGTQVVIEGADRLRAGTPVTVKLADSPSPSPPAGVPQCPADEVHAALGEPAHGRALGAGGEHGRHAIARS